MVRDRRLEKKKKTRDGVNGLLLLFFAVDHFNPLFDRVYRLTSDSDRHDRGTPQVLFRETFDRGRHRGREHDLSPRPRC